MSFFSRQPFALLGGLGLFGMVSNFTAVSKQLAEWAQAWKSVTRPIWDYALFWVSDIHWLLADYLTAGLITAGMVFRASRVGGQQLKVFSGPPKWFHVIYAEAIVACICIFIWPILLVIGVAAFWKPEVIYPDDDDSPQRLTQAREANMVFWETTIYAGILIALNFAFLQWWR